MGRKIRMNEHFGQTVAEVFQDFILAKTAEGVSDVTIRNYHQHLHNISKYLDIEQPMAALSKRDLPHCCIRCPPYGEQWKKVTRISMTVTSLELSL